MQTLKIGIVFCCLLLMPSLTKAQQEWSLQQCIEYALKNNLQVRIAALNNELSKANLDQSKANLLPNLNFGANNTYNFGKTIDRFTNQFANTRVQSINLGLQSQWTLYNGLQNYNTIKQNELNLMGGKYDVERTKNDVSLNIANAYLQILLARELVNITENQLNTSKTQSDRIKKLLDAGALPKSNFYDIEAQVSNEELNVVNAQNQLNMANLNLALLLNLNPDEFTINSPSIPNPSDLPINFTSQQVYSSALGSQPVIKSAEFRVKSAEKGVSIAKGAINPTLSFSGSIGTGYSGLAKQIEKFDSTVSAIGFTAMGDPVYSLFLNPVYGKTPYDKQFKDNINRSLGLTLNIPIFNNLRTHTGIVSAKINLETTRLQLAQAKIDLQRTINQAYLDATGALKKFNATEKTVKSLKESFKYVEQRYTVGTANSVDYNTQKNNVTNAEAQMLQAKYEYIFKAKVLDFYLGKAIVL